MNQGGMRQGDGEADGHGGGRWIGGLMEGWEMMVGKPLIAANEGNVHCRCKRYNDLENSV